MPDKSSKIQDPGVGASYQHKTKRIINPDGSFNVKRVGTLNIINDAYHWLITIPWAPFIAVVTSVILATNFVYALVYLIIGVEHISGVQPSGYLMDDFISALFFSVQTFTTVGYGAMAPIGNLTSLIASLEAFNGLLLSAFSTGILYGRFSRPISKIKFSQTALLTPYKNTKYDSIQFRVVNKRANTLLNIRASVYLSINAKSQQPGEFRLKRDFYDLSLERSSIMFLPLTWTIVHIIDENSPLYGINLKELVDRQTEMLITLNGFDETFGQDTYTYFSYFASEFEENKKFIRNFTVDDNGDIILNVDDVHMTEDL
ncbi:ion channel [Flammeovirga sp. SubArs3]|uniref:ion channel n=1 Tax=Flammeovirga sp. SubArs3 TaxID=2995316 RepID=UPI00248BDEDB|nr:ion channel [Flammeovirga sp. SubArs3]